MGLSCQIAHLFSLHPECLIHILCVLRNLTLGSSVLLRLTLQKTKIARKSYFCLLQSNSSIPLLESLGMCSLLSFAAPSPCTGPTLLTLCFATAFFFHSDYSYLLDQKNPFNCSPFFQSHLSGHICINITVAVQESL